MTSSVGKLAFTLGCGLLPRALWGPVVPFIHEGSRLDRTRTVTSNALNARLPNTSRGYLAFHREALRRALGRGV